MTDVAGYPDADQTQPEPAPTEPVSRETTVSPENEQKPVDEAAEARAARETMERLPRQRATPQEPRKPAERGAPMGPTKAAGGTEEEDPYAPTPGQPQDNGPALLERARLNAINSYYRGTLAGAAALSLWADTYRTPDAPDASPETKKANQAIRDQYENVLSDLIAYDVMPDWSGLPGLGAAVAGTVGGSVISPESFLGWASKGGTWLARTLWAGVQQGVITGASDPIIQHLNIGAGVQKEYEWKQTAGSFVFGAALGGGFHAAGEGAGHLIGQWQLRKMLSELGAIDQDLVSADHAKWARDPRTGIEAIEPIDTAGGGHPYGQEPDRLRAEEPAPERMEGPGHDYEEAVANYREEGAGEGAVSTITDEEARRAVFQEEIGTRLDAAMQESGVPPEKAAEIMKHYDRQAGESPDRAISRAIDNWAEAEERAGAQAGSGDAQLAKDLEDAAPPAAKEVPPAGWEPVPEALEEARRLSRGWTHEKAQPRPQSLTDFVRKNGGINIDMAGEFGDLAKIPFLLQKRNKGRGIGPDDMAMKARDAGYDIGQETDIGSGVNTDRFMEMLLEDAGGRTKHYTRGLDTEGYFEQQQRFADMDRYLADELGIRPKGMDPRQLAWLLSGEYARLKEKEKGRGETLGAGLPEEGGRISESSGAEPGQGRSTIGGGEEPTVRGEDRGRGAGTAGGEAGRPDEAGGGGAGGGAGAEAPRGERVEGPAAEAASVEKARAAMPAAVREEFDFLIAMGADKGNAAGRDAARYNELLQQYGGGGKAEPAKAATAEPTGGKSIGERHAEAVESLRPLQAEKRELMLKSKPTKADRARIDAINREIIEKLTIPEDVIIEVSPGGNQMERWNKVYQQAQKEGFSAEGARQLADRQIEKEFGPNKPQEEIGAPEVGEERPLLDTPEESPEVLAARQRAREKEEAEARMRGRQQSGVGQESAEDTPLFGGERQADLAVGEKAEVQELRANRANALMAGEERRDALMGIASANLSPDQTVRLQSLHQLAVNLAEALNIPLRQGRMNEPGVTRQTLGIYKTRSGVVRLREIADFEIVKHEVGHAIEAQVGAEMTTLTNAHRWELAPLDYDQGPTGQRVNEGFAEWMRIRMTNPAAAARLAPTFNAAFDSLMALRRPDILQTINDTAVAHRAFLEASSLDVGAAVVRNTIQPSERYRVLSKTRSMFDDIGEEITDEGLMPVVNTYLSKSWQWMQRRYDNFFDKFQDLERATREMLAIRQDQQGGGLVDFPMARDPSVMIRSLRRAGQGAHMQLQYGIQRFREMTPAPGVPSPRDALNHAFGAPFLGRWNPQTIEHFDQYVTAKMSSYLWERYDQGLIPNEPSPIKPGDARQILDELEARYPTFSRAADMLQEMYAEVRKKKRDAGLWTEEVYNETSQYAFYVPMRRTMEDGPGIGHNGGPSMVGSGENLASGVRRRVGSERDIDSPLRNIMRDIFFMEQDIRRNEIRGMLINLAESIPGEGGRYMERLPANEARLVRGRLDDMIKQRAREIGMPPAEAQAMIDTLLAGQDGPLMGQFFQMERAAANGEPIVFHWQGGEPIPYRVMSRIDKDMPEGVVQGRYKLFQLLTEAPAPIMDVWSNLLTIGANALRGGVTTNPTFLVANYIKDQLQVALSQPGYIPFYGGLRGIFDELQQTETARMRAEAGGVFGGSLVGEVERRFEAGVQDMAKQGYLIRRVTSWRGLMELMQLTEVGTRNSIFRIVYEQKLRQGLSSYEAAQEAAHRSTDIMDFSRTGDRMEQVRRSVPFLNPALQGTERYFFRGMIEPFFRRTLTIADQEARTRAIYTWMMSAGGGIAAGMGYAALNWQKDAYRDANPDIKGTHVVIPLTNGEVAVFPKPFELGAGFTIGEYAYAHWMEKDPRAAAQLGEALRQSLAPPDPIRNMPIVTPSVELMTNYSFFRKGPIVPDRLQNSAFPELEYDEKTSSLARRLGKELGWSPMKIDYALGSMFGSNGRDFMSATSLVDQETPTAALDDVLFARRFIKNEERISGRTRQFWELMGAKNGKYAADAHAYGQLVKESTLRGLPLTEATALLNKLPNPERAYVILHEETHDRGRPAFTADDRRMHPLARAHEAVSLLNGVIRDLNTNTLIPYRATEKIPVSPDQRRELIDDLRTMAGAEMRNAFAITGEPGYKGRPVLELQPYMDVIRKVSPAVADEIATRYATAKIYSTAAVQEAWPELQGELVRYGTEASIRALTAQARGSGYEFGGARSKKPGPVRAPILPQGVPARP